MHDLQVWTCELQHLDECKLDKGKWSGYIVMSTTQLHNYQGLPELRLDN